MAFVNEKLTPIQREELANKKIKNPYGSYQDIIEGINPLYLTIDKDTGTWLASCYCDRDFPEIKEFIFMYKSNPIPVQAMRNFYANQVCWKITRIDIPNDLMSENEQIRNLLADAFKTYNISGWPGEENGQAEVTFNC